MQHENGSGLYTIIEAPEKPAYLQSLICPNNHPSHLTFKGMDTFFNKGNSVKIVFASLLKKESTLKEKEFSAKDLV